MEAKGVYYERYPRQFFDQVWEAKPRRGRQRKVWGRRVNDIRGVIAR